MTQDHYNSSSDYNNLLLLSELLSFTKQKGIFIVVKLSFKSMIKKTVNHISNENTTSSIELRVGNSQD